MMDVATPIAAFAAGIATSFHCVGMCGPLSCAFFRSCSRNAATQSISYQIARIVSYSALGALAGQFGKPFAQLFDHRISHLFPWILAGIFILLAFDGFSRLPQPKFLARAFGSIRRAPVALQGISLGLVTPLIPCGPVYLMLGAALTTGSAMAGMLLLLFFGLGTLPIYGACQISALKLQNLLSPRTVKHTRQLVAGVSAVVILWRTIASSGSGLAWTCCH